MKKNRTISSIIFLFTLFSFSRCSIDYSKALNVDSMEESIPETVITNIQQVKVKNKKIVNKIEAAQTETYTQKKITVIKNLYFTEYNNTEVSTEGWADKSTYYLDTENADLEGNLYLYSKTEKTAIKADKLYWNNQEDRLTTDPSQVVHVKKDDGSFVDGVGFETDLKLKEITFSGKVTGKFVEEEKDDKK